MDAINCLSLDAKGQTDWLTADIKAAFEQFELLSKSFEQLHNYRPHFPKHLNFEQSVLIMFA